MTNHGYSQNKDCELEIVSISGVDIYPNGEMELSSCEVLHGSLPRQGDLMFAMLKKKKKKQMLGLMQRV